MATTLHIEGERVFSDKTTFQTLVDEGQVEVDGVTYYYEPTKYKYYVVGHYYDSTEIDTLFQAKLIAGAGISISEQNVISGGIEVIKI